MAQELKDAIRQRFLEARRNLLPEEVRASAEAIEARLWDMGPYQDAAIVYGYAASKDNEVDTLPMLGRVLAAKKQLMLPATEPGGIMAWQQVTDLSRLVRRRFGILEPEPECTSPVRKHDRAVALVPGIVFGVRGERIGYGGGYFDRFLEGFWGEKVALAYDMQVEKRLPCEAHDVLMDYIVTPSRIIDCRRERENPRHGPPLDCCS